MRTRIDFRLARQCEPYVFLAPALVLIGGFYLYPLLTAVVTSFEKASLLRGVQGFIGVRNYQAVLTSPEFHSSVAKTMLFTVVSVAAGMGLGIVGALLLNQDFKGRDYLRALAIVPWLVPKVMTAFLWQWLIQPSYGLLNTFLMALGIVNTPTSFLAPDSAMYTVIAMRVWRVSAFALLSTLAALQTVPAEVYEAAALDGASGFRQLVSVSMPLIRPALLATAMMLVIWSLVTFDEIFALTGGGPVGATELISIRIYRAAFHTGNLGEASAMVVLTVIATGILAWWLYRLMARE